MSPAGFETTLHGILAGWRSIVGPDRLEPWDYWHAVGAAARTLDALVPADRLLDLDHATWRRSGRTWRPSGSSTTSFRATAGR